MPMYTFFLRTPSGLPSVLNACELKDDGESLAKAGQLLDEHRSCDHVDIWDGERAVFALHRDQPIIRKIEAPAPIRPTPASASAK